MGALGDTIFALATGAAAAAIAVVRISGPGADLALRALGIGALPPPRQASLRHLHDACGAPIDSAVILRFGPGASYTGEAMAEVQCHGGRAVVARVLARLAETPGCRMAEPGEFTLRAFLAGRMDLTQVEALGDLIAAETERQRLQAMRMVNGALGQRVESWRRDLIRARALTEATIDWADEDTPEDVSPEVADLIERVRRAMDVEIARSDVTERLRAGFEVALIGAPNAGKSTLLNAIAGRDVAIAAPTPGTTRDVLELRCDIGGLPVTFLDMAGLRETEDPVEAIGVRRAFDRAGAADLRVLLESWDAPPGVASGLFRPGDLAVWTKADVAEGSAPLQISAATGAGVAGLIEAIGASLAERVAESGLVGHTRQRRALESAAGALQLAAMATDAEWIAAHLGEATVALERLIGRVAIDEVLDEVFATFCLGK